MGRRDTSRGPVIIAGGGTAGHLLPGIAIADALVAAGRPASSVAFVGGDRGVERTLVPAAGYEVTELPGRGIQRRLTAANLAAAWSLLRGVVAGVRLVRSRRPAVVVVLGGYASFACGVGAVVTRSPLVLVEQNARAGAVNRVLRRFAAASAVSFEGTDLPRSRVTGNPLRSAVVEAAARLAADPSDARRRARARFDIPEDRLVVVVTTGSLGARKVNQAVRELVELWAARDDVAIRHVVGRRDHAAYVADLPGLAPDGLCYQVVEYEDHMEDLLSAADVAVTRSGGGVAELAALGVPAVLVPLPGAPRDHQRANADHLVRGGAAILLDDDDCDGARLAQTLEELLADPGRLVAMRTAAEELARLDAAADAAALVEEVARGS